MMHSLHVPTYPSLASSRVIVNHVTGKLANRETAAMILDESNSPISLETRNLLFARVFSLTAISERREDTRVHAGEGLISFHDHVRSHRGTKACPSNQVKSPH